MDEREDRGRLAERHDSVWMLALGPSIWAVHLLLSYATVALWCAKLVGRDGLLGPAAIAVLVYTLIALLAIAAAGWRGLRQHRYGEATVPHDFDTDADRHRFLGFATVLLCGLSAIATLYVALPLLFVRSCG